MIQLHENMNKWRLFQKLKIKNNWACLFILICWWLCKKLGKDMERPQEYDDPNTVAANIIKMLGEIVSTG